MISGLCITPCVNHYSSSDGLSGTFSSPHYPEAYPTDSHCIYNFQGTIDERVRIEFTYFDLESGIKDRG